MNLESAAHFIGKDGFNWWLGQIENVDLHQILFTGKVKVSCRLCNLGYNHSPNKGSALGELSDTCHASTAWYW